MNHHPVSWFNKCCSTNHRVLLVGIDTKLRINHQQNQEICLILGQNIEQIALFRMTLHQQGQVLEFNISKE